MCSNCEVINTRSRELPSHWKGWAAKSGEVTADRLSLKPLFCFQELTWSCCSPCKHTEAPTDSAVDSAPIDSVCSNGGGGSQELASVFTHLHSIWLNCLQTTVTYSVLLPFYQTEMLLLGIGQLQPTGRGILNNKGLGFGFSAWQRGPCKQVVTRQLPSLTGK